MKGLRIGKLFGLLTRLGLSLVCLVVLAFALSACSQTGAGLNAPTVKQELSGKKSIVPSAAALTLDAENHCGAQSQVDYAALVLFCEGKAPQLPISFQSTYEMQTSQFACETYGYTNSSNQLIVPQTVQLGGVDGQGSSCVAPVALPATATKAS